MEKRRFGRTGHMSSVAIFGGFALSEGTQAEADQVMEKVIEAGVNHIDIAPSYGHAEARLGPWMPRIRDQFFLGCKTMERDKVGANKEMHESLKRLKTDSFDLYQIHAITNMNELDQATRSGAALDAMIEARKQGLTKHIGITGHGLEAPTVFLEALARFDFDTVLFAVNFVLFAIPEYRIKAEELLATCAKRDVGVMAIKAIAKAPWGDRDKTSIVWYEPFTDEKYIQDGVNFTLSQNVTGFCTAGDPTLLPVVLNSCENHVPMNADEQAAIMAEAGKFENIFT
jgi:aryl-alcohol dehydrogenase-like predicted oxidoreductase